MKRRVISLLVALLLLLSVTAAAEPAADSTLYTLAIYDPAVYVNDEPILDMTGLELDLSLGVSDSGTNGILIELLAGENYDFLTGAYVQLDANGLSFCLDGMSNVYTVDVDPYLSMIDPSLEGMSLGQLASMLPMRTLMSAMDFSGVSFDIDLSGETRFAVVEAIASLTANDIQSNGDATEYTFSFTAEQTRELIDLFVQEAENQNVEMDDETIDALKNVALELSGKMVSGAAQEMNLTGKLWFDYAADRYADVTVTYTDDKVNANLDVTAVNHVDANDAAYIVGTAVSTVGADGRVSTEYDVVVDVLGDAVQLYAAQMPAEDSAEIDYGVEFYVPAEEVSAGLYWTTNINPEGEGFYIEASATESDETSGIYAYYEGVISNDPSIGDYRDGYFQAGVYSGEESYDLTAGILMLSQDLAVADWAFDSTGAIDVLTMSETEVNTAAMGLMGVIGNVIPALQTAVPGLAPILEALTSSMLG